MKSKWHMISTYLINFLVIYNAFLINGGRGPFMLNESYWACHCDDANSVSSEIKEENPLHPAIIGMDNRSASADSLEICFAPRTESENTVCKKKLPLRYLDLLLSGADIIHSPVISPLANRSIPFSQTRSRFYIRTKDGICRRSPPTSQTDRLFVKIGKS